MHLKDLLGSMNITTKFPYIKGEPLVELQIGNIIHLELQNAKVVGTLRIVGQVEGWPVDNTVQVAGELQLGSQEWWVAEPDHNSWLKKETGFSYLDIFTMALSTLLVNETGIHEEELCIRDNIVGKLDEEDGTFTPYTKAPEHTVTV